MLETNLETYLNMLDLAFYEAPFAFEGLANEKVWKRPATGLLSVGELAGHVAYWLASRFAGEGADPMPDVSNCKVTSPLIDDRFAYYPHTLAASPTPQHLAMTAEEVRAELLRVHAEAVAYLRALNPDLDTCGPGWPPHFNYGETVKYTVFHVSYHVGQMYSVRHLLGDVTPDN